MLSSPVKSFLQAASDIKFHDGSGVESYETPNELLRFRGVRADGHTEIGFQTLEAALLWAWELRDEAAAVLGGK